MAKMKTATKRTAAKRTATKKTVEEGKYIYCIIGTNEEKIFGSMGIGGRGDEVYTVCYQDQGVVVSSSPITKYPITRENTMVHQKVMEELMKEYTVLPVRFGTIAESKDGASPEERIKEHILEKRREEFEGLLEEMHDKVELGVKSLWTDMDVIFQEIAERNTDIRVLKRKLMPKSPLRTRDERVKLGEMVKKALEAKRDREAKEILKVLKPICIDRRMNKIFGDKMILNAAFLVDTHQEDEFDREMNELETSSNGRVKFKYVGPVPILNFVEIVITWED